MTDTWHIGSMNDMLFIIDQPPRPSTDDPVYEHREGINPTFAIPLPDLPLNRAQQIVDAHNAALRSERVRGEESMRAGDLSDFWTRHAAWSNATFGDESERGPLGPLRHLEKEAKEAQDATDDILEYADCLLLILDATRRAGFTLADLTDAANRKLEICKARVWPKTAKDQAVEHVRTPTTETTHG